MSENDSLLKARRTAGQLIMIRVQGTELSADEAQFLRDNHIRAVCLFRKNMIDAAQLSKFTADLRDVMGENALIAIDQEGGAVVRATWLPPPPAAMGLGAANDPVLCRDVGAAVARGLKSLGFNWNFAPVLDLNNNLANPVIAERSFGSSPQSATALALAWMAGSLSEGVACCVKHFPGHGDTHVDSHRALPTVDKPIEELAALEFLPFIAAKDAPAMMSAHIVYSALDAQYPATLSPRILTGLLRNEFGYRGVIITDGMDMQAITDRYGAGNAAVLALKAGTDMVMELGTREAQVDTLQTIACAIDAGQFADGDLEARIARLDALAGAYPCVSQPYTTEINDRALMARAWCSGLTAYGNPQRPPVGSKIRVVVREDAQSDGVSEAGISARHVTALLSRFYDVSTVAFTDSASFDWRSLPQDGRLVILASTTRLRYGEHVRTSWKPDLHLALWNPFQALDVDAPALLTYGFAAPALDAIAAWLDGRLEPSGVCPVDGFSEAV